MKHILIFAIAIFSALQSGAQTAPQPPATTVLNYRIDYYRPDSFYLVEIKETVTIPNVRGKSEEEAVLIRDTAQLSFIIKSAMSQEAEYRQKIKDFRQMREEITRLYGILQERIKNNELPK